MIFAYKIMCITETTIKRVNRGMWCGGMSIIPKGRNDKRKPSVISTLPKPLSRKLEEVENRRKRKVTDRIEENAVKRQKGLDIHGENRATEAKAIRFLAKYISNLSPVTDGARGSVKISNLCKMMGWGLQIKSTAQRGKQGKAVFSKVNKIQISS